MDVMEALRIKKTKAEAKVGRAAKALELARKELADLLAAERVMADITGESVGNQTQVATVNERDQIIARLLGVGPEASRTPAELYPIYVEETGDDTNLDAFRTALWRLQKKVLKGSEKSWTVHAVNGRYWREAADSAVESELDEIFGASKN